MRFLTAVRAELARLTATRIGVAALVALMTIPVAYGGLYLWGNHDPYGALDRVPAGIVVEDRGASIDGEQRELGRDAADAVIDDASFGWRELGSAAQARAAVRDGEVDFALVFPRDFSADLASASGDEPATAQLGLLTSDTNSALSTTLAEQAARSVREEVTAELGREASLTLLDGVAQLREGLVDAADGAGELAGGAASLEDGTGSLASGTASLASGAGRLSGGLRELRDGTRELPAQTARLASGVHEVRGAVDEAAAAVERLEGVVGEASSAADAARADLVAALDAAGVPAEQQAPILARLDGLRQAAAGAAGEAQTAAARLPELQRGAAELDDGAARLAAASPALASGIAEASTGADALASGAGTAASGAARLDDGAGELVSGARELRDGLRDGVEETPATTAAERTASADAIAEPVEVAQDALTEAADYGAGLAPFFISLAAWIGIYALFLLVRPLSRRALTAGRHPVSTALAGWATPAALGAIQMLGLFLVVVLALGLAPANPLGMLGFMVLVSAAFAAIVLALNVLLGSVGQFLGLVLMILQLVTAGGTFPWQTLPEPLAALHQVLPMAHAVDGLRILVYGGDAAALPGAILPIAGWLVAGLALAAAGAARQSRTRLLRELRPSPLGG